MAQSTDGTVYSGLADPATHAPGTLFQSWDIWIAMRVPQRSLYIQKVQQNGGRVVPLEKNSHVMIADHLRKDAPPGTISYKWIDKCMADARIVDRAPFPAGPSLSSQQVRPVGALAPATTGRKPFTAEDDRVLHKWVSDRNRRGEYIKGNEIYKQLEQHNPRHPWQSWRDRWIKYVSHKHPTTSVSQETPPTPPSEHEGNETRSLPRAAKPTAQTGGPSTREKQEQPLPRVPLSDPKASSSTAPDPQPAAAESRNAPRAAKESTSLTPSLPKPPISTPRRPSSTPNQRGVPRTPETSATAAELLSSFTEADRTYLLENAQDIEKVPVGKYDDIWEDLHQAMSQHSAGEWRKYYELVVLPEWKEGNVRIVDDLKSAATSPFAHKISTAAVDAPRTSPDSATHKRKRGDGAAVLGRDRQPSTKRSRGDTPHVGFYVAAEDDPIQLSPSELARKFSQSQKSKGSRPPPQVEVIGIESDDAVEAAHVDAENPNEAENGLFVHLVRDDGDDDGGTRSLAQAHQPAEQPNFGVYEDVELPEEEKENVVVDASGSFSIPPRHVHVRSDEALDAFSDPLPKFILRDSGPDNAEEPESEDEEEEFDTAKVVNESQNRHVLEIAEDDGEAPQVFHFEDLGGTQEILDAETQLLDTFLPLPPDDEEDDDAPLEVTASQTLTKKSKSLFITDDSDEDVQLMVEEVEQDIVDEDDDEDDDYELMAVRGTNRGERDEVIDAELQDYLEVPLPPEFDSDQGVVVDRSTESGRARKIAAAETQDILDVETQYPDLSVPPPPSTQDIPSSPPQIPPSHPTISKITVRKEIRDNPLPRPQSPLSSSRPQSSSQRQSEGLPNKPLKQGDDLNAFMAEQLTLGHKESHIAYALQRSSCYVDKALEVLALLRQGKSVPKGVKGLWTLEDDEVVRGGTAREIEQLEELHGKEAFNERVRCLHNWEYGQDGDDEE